MERVKDRLVGVRYGGLLRGGIATCAMAVALSALGFSSFPAIGAVRSLNQDQPAAAEMWWAAVSQEAAAVRCGRAVEFYEIGTLKAGTLLQVKASDENGWASVVVGPLVSGFIPVDAVTASADGKLAKVNARTRVYYAAGNDPVQSWVSVEVQAGAELAVQEKVSTTNKGDFYRVRMPAETVGYVLSNAIRQATAEEIESWKAKLAAEAVTLAPLTAPTTAPTTEPSASGASESTQEQNASDTEQAPSTEVAESAGTPEAAAVEGQSEVKPDEPPKPRKPSSAERLRDLEQLYQETRKARPEEAEVAALQSEYRRLADDPATSQSVRRACSTRVELLQLRIEQQAAQQRLDEAIRRAKEPIQNPALSTPAGELPRYDVIGKLMMSNVYDGKRLQLLYRVQDVSSGRTIAYLVPDEEMQISSRLNRIVGIVGSLNRDESMLIPVVTAKRVDDLRPEE